MPRTRLFQARNNYLLRAAALPAARGRSVDTAASELIENAVANQVLLEAVAVASPSLRTSLSEWQSNPAAFRQDRITKLATALLKYELRMRSRPTPFGLFAGVTTGVFSRNGSENLYLGTVKKIVRIDQSWARRTISDLESDRATVGFLTAWQHPAAADRQGRVVNPWPRGTADGTEMPVENSVRVTPPVTLVLTKFRSPIRVATAIEQLSVGYPLIPVDSWFRLVIDLMAQGLLMTELRPPLDGSDDVVRLFNIVKAIPSDKAQQLSVALSEVRQERERYSTTPLGAGISALDAMTDSMEASATSGLPLHIDLAFNGTIALPLSVHRDAEQALAVLWRLSSARLGAPGLRGYHNDFLERYGRSRLIPILELVDEDSGLGAPDGYLWPHTRDSDQVPSALPEKRQKRLTALAVEAIGDRQRELEITDTLISELEPLDDELSRLPVGAELYLQLVADSAAQINRGDYRLVFGPNPGTHFPGATSARFLDMTSWASDTPTASFGSTLACVYEPRSAHATNVANVPVSATYLLDTGVGHNNGHGGTEARLEDLAIGADEDGLYLVETARGDRLMPIAHHVLDPRTQAPNAVRLLLEIAREGVRAWEPFSWGTAEQLPYLPRVRYGRVVLRSAQWRLDDLATHAQTNDTDWESALAAWRTRWSVPYLVLAVDNDNRIELDLRSPLQRLLLRSMIRSNEAAILYEVPGGEDRRNEWLVDQDGEAHSSELVITLDRRTHNMGDKPFPTVSHALARPERFGLGSEWLYLKLFLSHKRQDTFISQELRPFIRELRAKGVIDSWFFLRYSIGGAHVRLRLHSPALTVLNDLIPAVHGWLNGQEERAAIRKAEFAEYEPEWHRYGGPTLQDDLHSVFASDSDMGAGLLRFTPDIATRETLMAASVLDIASIFASKFHEPIESWLRHFATTRDLTSRQRRERATLHNLIRPEWSWAGLRSGLPHGDEMADTLSLRKLVLEDFANAVLASTNAETLWGDPKRICASLAHMTCNRFNGLASAERAAQALALSVAREIDRWDGTRVPHLQEATTDE